MMGAAEHGGSIPMSGAVSSFPGAGSQSSPGALLAYHGVNSATGSEGASIAFRPLTGSDQVARSEAHRNTAANFTAANASRAYAIEAEEAAADTRKRAIVSEQKQSLR